MNGIVIKSSGSRCFVKSQDIIYDCVLKGKIRLEGRKTTNPIAVGDLVDFDLEASNFARLYRSIFNNGRSLSNSCKTYF